MSYIVEPRLRCVEIKLDPRLDYFSESNDGSSGPIDADERAPDILQIVHHVVPEYSRIHGLARIHKKHNVAARRHFAERQVGVGLAHAGLQHSSPCFRIGQDCGAGPRRERESKQDPQEQLHSSR